MSSYVDSRDSTYYAVKGQKARSVDVAQKHSRRHPKKAFTRRHHVYDTDDFAAKLAELTGARRTMAVIKEGIRQRRLRDGQNGAKPVTDSDVRLTVLEKWQYPDTHIIQTPSGKSAQQYVVTVVDASDDVDYQRRKASVEHKTTNTVKDTGRGRQRRPRPQLATDVLPAIREDAVVVGPEMFVVSYRLLETQTRKCAKGGFEREDELAVKAPMGSKKTRSRCGRHASATTQAELRCADEYNDAVEDVRRETHALQPSTMGSTNATNAEPGSSAIVADLAGYVVAPKRRRRPRMNAASSCGSDWSLLASSVQTSDAVKGSISELNDNLKDRPLMLVTKEDRFIRDKYRDTTEYCPTAKT